MKEQKKILQIFIYPGLIILIYFLALFFGKVIYKIAIVELLNSALVVLLSLLLGMVISKQELFRSYHIYSNLLLHLLFYFGILGLFNFVFNIIGYNFPLLYLSDEYATIGTSLVPDNNFYSLFYILALIFLISRLYKQKEHRSRWLIQIFMFVYTLNVIFSVSRRGILAYFIILGITGILLVFHDRNNKNLNSLWNLKFYFFLNVLILIIIIGLFSFRVSLFTSTETRINLTKVIHKLSSMFDPNLTITEAYSRLWYSNQPRSKENSNLLYNGNFENGMNNWYTDAEGVSTELIETPYGKGLLVTRTHGDDMWSLQYAGRPVFYQKNIKYTFSFNVRFLTGNIQSFNVGWWTKDDSIQISSVGKRIIIKDNGWLYCESSYLFKESHDDIWYSFINSQKANTIFEIADVRLFSEPQLETKNYIDEIDRSEDSTKMATTDQFFGPRKLRWTYFNQLWTEKYSTIDKFFGRGFKYFEWYGNRFYQNSLHPDWPHNPFLSVLLYSGILGFTLYILFLVRVLQLYFKYRSILSIALNMMILSGFFCFFSSNGPLSPPIMGFLLILPYFVKYISRRQIIKIRASINYNTLWRKF